MWMTRHVDIGRESLDVHYVYCRHKTFCIKYFERLTVNLLFFCSTEEQFFINGHLSEFYQVGVPDVWIGLSGELSAAVCLCLCV